MTRIVFLDRSTMAPLAQLERPAFAHEWIEHDRTRPEKVVERLKDCDIAISNKVPISTRQHREAAASQDDCDSGDRL